MEPNYKCNECKDTGTVKYEHATNMLHSIMECKSCKGKSTAARGVSGMQGPSLAEQIASMSDYEKQKLRQAMGIIFDGEDRIPMSVC